MTSSEEKSAVATGVVTVPQRMLDAAICAYSITPQGYFPKPFFEDPVGFVGSPNAWADSESAINAGLVGITDDGWAVISLRGTLGSYSDFKSFIAFIRDWLQDDETSLVPLRSSDGTYLGNVHHGFHKATMALWPYFGSILQDMDWSKLKGLRITGHSKGAGMTFIMAALAEAEKGKMNHGGPKCIEVHAFAAPLAGDPDFASHYKSAGLDKCTTRYQRAHDIVPFLPPYVSFDLLHHVDLWKVHLDFELDAAIEFLKLTVTRGYHLVGGLEFLPDHTPGGPAALPIDGHAGQLKAQAAILAAIKCGCKDEIAAAHSATGSYWPAIFGKELPKKALAEMTKHYEREFGVAD